tara:strand:+ start:413 stop:1198 length:786 start_codon:yes stop_codon:yes gene_type:complete
VANSLAELSSNTLVVSSAMGLNPALKGHHGDPTKTMQDYFNERFYEEKRFFKDRFFKSEKMSTLVVGAKEINHSYVAEQVENFCPDIIIVFGTNIIKGKLLSVTKKILNLHLGMSPYYNGSYTNFWPMYNEEYEFVGATIHYIDAGVDTGDILGQTRPEINENDTPHTIGNKTIIRGVQLIKEIIPILHKRYIPGIKQWSQNYRPVYLMKNYNGKIEREFFNKIKNGSIPNWCKNSEKKKFKMVRFRENSPEIINDKINLD